MRRARARAEGAAAPRALGGRHERELRPSASWWPDIGSPVRWTAGVAGTEGHERDGELVHAVGADERGHLRVGEGREEPRRQPAGVGEGERLGEHRARVPVDVAEAALAVAPAGAPRHPGDDEGHRLARRRRPEDDEGVGLGVVPVQARLEAVDAGAVRTAT